MKLRLAQAGGARRRQRRRRASTPSRSATARCTSAPSCASSRCSRTSASAPSLPLLRPRRSRYVGYRATRHRGTVGGSLALRGAVGGAARRRASRSTRRSRCARARGDAQRRGARRSSAARTTTALEPDELIAAVRFPSPPARTGAACHEVSARYRDYAQVAAAAVVTLDAGGSCSAAELVLLRVQRAPYRADVAALAARARGRGAGRRRAPPGAASSRPTTSRPPARTAAGSPRCSPGARCATRAERAARGTA